MFGVGVVVPAGVYKLDMRVGYFCGRHLVVGIAHALEVAPFASHRLDGVFVNAEDGYCFVLNLYQLNVRDDAGAGYLFALVDPALNRFGLHGHANNCPCVTDAHQHGTALGIGKRGECFDHFFLKAAFEFNKRTFALPDSFQQRGCWKFGG